MRKIPDNLGNVEVTDSELPGAVRMKTLLGTLTLTKVEVLFLFIYSNFYVMPDSMSMLGQFLFLKGSFFL